MNSQDQRNHFARQLSWILKTPPMTFLDWADSFEYLNHHIQSGDIIVLDEISWMGSKDPTFIPKLKAWWDSVSTRVVTFFCGSVLTWIEDNFLKSTAFLGRIHLVLTLAPLTISESFELLKHLGIHASSYDTLKLLSILGGVPWYLEQLQPYLTADHNIHRLAFQKTGLLVEEFNRIFHDLFNGKGALYKKIIDFLKDGPKTLSEIREGIHFAQSGTLSQLLEHLVTSGFVVKNALWSLKTTQKAKQSLYSISDPYIRFYLKMIEPNMHQISSDNFSEISLYSLPGFEAHLEIQLEYLLIQNHRMIIKALGVHAADIVCSGPYRQNATTTQKGCQIDYLVQTTTKNLFACEFKFKRREISSEIIDEMKEKLSRFKAPSGYAKVPVLFHLSGVSETVATQGYFYRIIDITDFLEDNL